MKYQKTLEVVTFEEFVEFGRRSGATLHNGMPWSFEFHGRPVTHETDECYLIDSLRFTPSEVIVLDGDQLIVGPKEDFSFLEAKGSEWIQEPVNARISGSTRSLIDAIDRKLLEQALHALDHESLTAEEALGLRGLMHSCLG